jgi:hypothetical protein
MGVTIHYQGKLNPKIKVKELHIYAGLICREMKWEITDMVETDFNGHRFEITPHVNCEALLFRITPEGYFSDHCKTQFAPLEVHKNIISLFQQIKIKLSELIIQDEGGYWESHDEKFLEERIMNCFYAIQKEMDNNPDAYGPVKSEDGRIVDLIK